MEVRISTRIANRLWLPRAATVLTIIAALGGQRPAAAAPPEPVAGVAGYLQAGEFSLALESARNLPEGAQRQSQLQQIAAAQQEAGLNRAALATTAELESDQERYAALQDLASPMARGGAQADFDPLIELITSTIAPPSWDDVGGAGAIDGFEAGVYVDAEGVLRKLIETDATPALAALRTAAQQPKANQAVRQSSRLRKVSLPRLEKQIALLKAAGREPSEAMSVLAGLSRIEFVFVYPEQGEIVLAGPAGDWRKDAEGRIVSAESGAPVLQLDDLIVLMRHTFNSQEPRFGCSIVPRQDSLARTKAFIEQSSVTPLKQGQRKDWLQQLRSTLGQQDIEVYGIDPRTRLARVLVEADYRMKLVGMGLEEGVVGVTSYLDSIRIAPGEAPPAMDVLRWWFTLNYSSVEATQERHAFQFKGQGVQVLSENELLTALGERVHTGASEELNAQFARQFTQQFPALAAKYPVYAELRSIFDLALVAALLKKENLPDQAQWSMTGLLDPQLYKVSLGFAPKTVQTVINHRVINKVHVVAGVSGGVSADAAKLLDQGLMRTDTYGALSTERAESRPDQLPADAWWWD